MLLIETGFCRAISMPKDNIEGILFINIELFVALNNNYQNLFALGGVGYMDQTPP